MEDKFKPIEVTCDRCGENLGNAGVLKQMDHLSVCPNNKPVNLRTKITKKDLEKMVEKVFSLPKEFEGTTICGKIWKDSERHVIATCDDQKCERCTTFNKMLMSYYEKDV